MDNNKITFTSKINFISTNKFEKIWRSKITPQNIVDEPWTFAETKLSKEYLGTSAINTCTSLNIARKINKKNNINEAIMFHLSTCKENFQKFDEYMKPFLNFPDGFNLHSVLLIGSKAPTTPGLNPELLVIKKYKKIYDKNSSRLFEMIEDVFKRFKPTIFQGHANANTCSNYIYDIKNDTYYINTKLNIFNFRSSVKNFDDLNKAFDRIEISPRDEVNFII